MPRISKLFEPIKVGEVELKNRLVMLGMTTGLGEDFRVTNRLVDFLVARARGGIGLVTLGTVYPADFDLTQPLYRTNKLGIGIWSDEFIPGLRTLTKAIHDNGAKASCQLMLCYEWRPDKGASLEVVGPSDGPGGLGIGDARALNVEEIRKIVEQFGEGARRAREAGFDMVEFQSGMGYLLNRFLSSRSNKRTDDYGGSLEKRKRLLLEIIDCAKNKAGSDFTFICRLSADEFIDGGNTLEDTKKIIPILEKAGVAAINVQAGWHESRRPFVQQWVPAGAFVYLAKEIKKVTDLPVITAYRIDDPILAEEIVAKGKADIIGLGRALIADPEFPSKAKEGRFDEIRRCIACCRCIDDTFEGRTISCSVNASLDIAPVRPALEKKRVLIGGGGPAGMEAARIAATRGHKVTLVEKGQWLGGLLIMGAVLNDKLENLTKWMRLQIKTLPIEVRLRAGLTPALLKEVKPDAIIIALGGVPKTLEVPGVGGSNVISSYDIKNLINGVPPKKGVLWSLGAILVRFVGDKPGIMRRLMRMNFPIQKNVIIIGGQFAGLELALGLMERGKKVTVIEESEYLGTDVGPVSRWVELDMLRSGGVRMETMLKVQEITEKGVKVSRESANEELLEADTVMMALPLKEDSVMPDDLEGKAPNLYIIGDAAGGSGVRRIREAIASGFYVASRI